jgi:hypothetical protein
VSLEKAVIPRLGERSHSQGAAWSAPPTRATRTRAGMSYCRVRVLLDPGPRPHEAPTHTVSNANQPTKRMGSHRKNDIKFIPQLAVERQKNIGLPSRLQTALSRVVYVEHPMRTGGSGFCVEWCNAWRCKYPLEHGRNCRLLSFWHCDWAQGFQRMHHNTVGWDSPNVTEEHVLQFFRHVRAELCGLIMNEPGFIHSKVENKQRFAIEHLGVASFWHVYTTVLLVRDPLQRFLSAMSLTCRVSFTEESKRVVPEECKSPKGRLYRLSTLFSNDTLLSHGGADYLTRHVLPTYTGWGPAWSCNASTIAHAKAAVDAFDLVLNIADLPRETMAVAHRVLGLDLGSRAVEKAYNMTNGTGYRSKQLHDGVSWLGRPLDTGVLSRFWRMNQCDYSMVEHGNARLLALARLL